MLHWSRRRSTSKENPLMRQSSWCFTHGLQNNPKPKTKMKRVRIHDIMVSKRLFCEHHLFFLFWTSRVVFSERKPLPIEYVLEQSDAGAYKGVYFPNGWSQKARGEARSRLLREFPAFVRWTELIKACY